MVIQSRMSRNDRAAAAVMQRNLLPARLPEVAGLEFAARYVAGGDGMVGGDWYDVFTLPTGAVCLVVGDVVGHGVAAALSMSQIRVVLRSTALLDGIDDLVDVAVPNPRGDCGVEHVASPDPLPGRARTQGFSYEVLPADQGHHSAGDAEVSNRAPARPS